MNSIVKNALKNIDVPVSYLKRHKAPVSISYFIGNGVPVGECDDKYTHIEYSIQVDIWAEYGSSITKLIKDVLLAMESNRFTLYNTAPDLYEYDTNLLHKALEFKYLEEI